MTIRRYQPTFLDVRARSAWSMSEMEDQFLPDSHAPGPPFFGFLTGGIGQRSALFFAQT